VNNATDVVHINHDGYVFYIFGDDPEDVHDAMVVGECNHRFNWNQLWNALFGLVYDPMLVLVVLLYWKLLQIFQLKVII